jgi:hypothetical protein
MSFDTFETQAFSMLGAGDEPLLAIVRTQLETCRVRERENSSFGRLTDLWVEDGVPLCEVTDRFSIDDVFCRVEGVDEPAQILLHFNRGRIATLEAFVAEGPWPEEPTVVEMWYVAPDDDDAGQLARVDARDLGFATRGPHRAGEEI